MRPALSILLMGLLFLVGCRSAEQESSAEFPRRDTISYHSSGTPAIIQIQREETGLERRTYRPTGTLQRIERGDSVQTYLDLHPPDSASVLKDYLQGRWRNLSADTSQSSASAFYVFDDEQLTFENPAGTPLESVDMQYENNRLLTTEEGMTVEATIIDFDTVEVTGYTLVRTESPQQ